MSLSASIARISELNALVNGGPPPAPPPVPAPSAAGAETFSARLATAQATDATRPARAPGKLAEMFYDPKGGIDNGRDIGAIGGHGAHVHVAMKNPQAMLSVIALARQMGLRVGENPYVDPVDAQHAPGSFHGQLFPGGANGKPLGKAADISGDPAKLAKFYDTVAERFR